MKNIRYFHPAVLILALTIEVFLAPSMAQAQSSQVQPSRELPNPLSLNKTGMPLKPGNRLNLTVAGFSNLSGEQVIMSDGTIQLPMIEAIQVAGLSAIQVSAALTKAW